MLPEVDAYEIRFLPVGSHDRLPLLFALDDAGAIQLALLVKDDREMQVWCGSRLVAAFPARGLADMMTEPSAHALPTVVSPISFVIH